MKTIGYLQRRAGGRFQDRRLLPTSCLRIILNFSVCYNIHYLLAFGPHSNSLVNGLPSSFHLRAAVFWTTLRTPCLFQAFPAGLSSELTSPLMAGGTDHLCCSFGLQHPLSRLLFYVHLLFLQLDCQLPGFHLSPTVPVRPSHNLVSIARTP